MADNDKKENGADSKSSTTPHGDKPAENKTSSKASSPAQSPDTTKPQSSKSEKGKSVSGSGASASSKSTSKKPTPATSKPVSRSAEKKSPSTGGLWFFVILTFLLTLALAGAGYWYWKQRADNNQAVLQSQSEQAERIDAMNRQNRDLQSELAQLAESKQALNQAISELQNKTQALARQSEQALSQLENMEGKRPSDWLLAEADYLVRMAGRKVWLEKDIKTAIMLLSNADERLSELSDPSVLPVREKIAKDIQMLRQLNPVSRTSVALAISGMLSQVESLPLDTF